MILENHVTSLELSKKLAELGVKQDSLFYWSNCPECGDEWNLHQLHASDYIQYSAFLTSELGKLLPTILDDGIVRLQLSWSQDMSEPDKRKWKLCYCDPSVPWDERYWIGDENEANARAKCLIWLLENRLWELPE